MFLCWASSQGSLELISWSCSPPTPAGPFWPLHPPTGSQELFLKTVLLMNLKKRSA